MKLVRDNIPQIIKESGKEPIYREATDREYREFLFEKLLEEATEVVESDGDLQELADISEVLAEIMKINHYDAYDLEISQAIKRKENGGFSKRYILEKVK